MDTYFRKLKEAGFKITPRRKAIIDIFINCDTHLTTEEVWNKLQKKFAQCGLPSVYRNLESLTKCGILTRIQQFDRRKHYGLCTSFCDKHHHHIVCVSCGKVDKMELCSIQNRKILNGYKIINHFVQVNGICSQCR